MSLFTQTPEIKRNPNGRVPLVALVYFQTEVPVSVTIYVSDGRKSWQVKFNESHDPTQGFPIAVSYTHLTLPTTPYV